MNTIVANFLICIIHLLANICYNVLFCVFESKTSPKLLTNCKIGQKLLCFPNQILGDYIGS